MLLMTPLSHSAIGDVDWASTHVKKNWARWSILPNLPLAVWMSARRLGDGHVGTQERRLLSSAGVRVVLLSKKRGIQTVDLFGARVVCSKLVERGWVDAFFLSGGGSS